MTLWRPRCSLNWQVPPSAPSAGNVKSGAKSPTRRWTPGPADAALALPVVFFALAFTLAAGAVFLAVACSLAVALRGVAGLALALAAFACFGLVDAAFLAAGVGFATLGDGFFAAAFLGVFVPCFGRALAVELVFLVGFLALAITGLPDGDIKDERCVDHSFRIKQGEGKICRLQRQVQGARRMWQDRRCNDGFNWPTLESAKCRGQCAIPVGVMVTSTRRFLARPAAVLFEASGCSSPMPETSPKVAAAVCPRLASR